MAVKLSKTQMNILRALVNGATLKSHRYLDGRKVYQLHPLNGPGETVRRPTVDALRDRGLIHSNQKFPAATYLLTDQGQAVAGQLAEAEARPVATRNYFQE
jgi:hypothetical protein